MRSLIISLGICAWLAVPAASEASSHQHGRHDSGGMCSNGKSTDAAMWYSILHPGVGEWYLNGFGSFNANAPQKKFWLGFIPFYGYGYLTVKSAVDAKHCRTNDDLSRRYEVREARRD